jgi:hypothetical protein
MAMLDMQRQRNEEERMMLQNAAIRQEEEARIQAESKYRLATTLLADVVSVRERYMGEPASSQDWLSDSMSCS